MKVAVAGAGAIGAYVGALLSRAGCDVTLIARGPHFRALAQHGVRVQSINGDFEARPRVVDSPAATGAAGFYYDYDSFQETQVSTAQHSAEIGTPGVYYNIIVKSGTDRFRGGAGSKLRKPPANAGRSGSFTVIARGGSSCVMVQTATRTGAPSIFS